MATVQIEFSNLFLAQGIDGYHCAFCMCFHGPNGNTVGRVEVTK